jgi:hypothetical protein
MNALISTTPLSNRSEKRKFEHEAMKFAPALQVIIDKFIGALWVYPDHISYLEIYTYYSGLWNQQIDHFQHSEAKTIGIDRTFFETNYKPQI